VSQIELIETNGMVVEQVPPAQFPEFFTVEGLFDEIVALDRTVKDLEVQYQ